MDAFRRALFVLPVFGQLVVAGCQPAARPPANIAESPAAGVVAAPAESVGDPEAALVAAYKAAHASKDVEAMLRLYWFGSADDEMRLTIRENIIAEMRCPLVDIKIEPADRAKHGPTVEGGVRWRPSLEVTSMVTANFDTSAKPAGGYYTERFKHGAGRRGDKCYFVVPIRE